MAAPQKKGHKMDIEEFQKQMQPKAKRSKLEPFKAQIFELKEKGYANWQVCEWLASNGVKISGEGLRKFIHSRQGDISQAVKPAIKTAAATDTKQKKADDPLTKPAGFDFKGTRDDEDLF